MANLLVLKSHSETREPEQTVHELIAEDNSKRLQNTRRTTQSASWSVGRTVRPSTQNSVALCWQLELRIAAAANQHGIQLCNAG